MPLSVINRTALSLLLVASLSAEAAEVKLKRSVKSKGSLVLLSDVAQVQDADPTVVRALERIELFPSPTGGRARTLRIREVRELMRLNGVDLTACRFTGAQTCRINSQPVERPVVVTTRRPAEASTPAGSIVVAVRPLSRGEIVTAADVMLRPITESARKVAGIGGRAIAQRVDEVVGYELTRSISANRPIHVNSLQRRRLVRQGETIQVIARAAGVTVRTTARAMEDGSQGQLITLQSTENREKYSARVTGPQQAEVYASGRMAVGVPIPRTGDRRYRGVPIPRASDRSLGVPMRTSDSSFGVPIPGTTGRSFGVPLNRGGVRQETNGVLSRPASGWRPAASRIEPRNRRGG
jgi:flagella basal body P-ring formation protein FlgA